MKKFVVLLLCILTILPAFAFNRWLQIAPKTWIDLNSYYRDSNIVSLWIKDLNQGQYEYKNYKVWFSLIKTKYNCDNFTFSIERALMYDTKGKVLIDTDIDSILYPEYEGIKNSMFNWQAAPPDTDKEWNLKVACTLNEEIINKIIDNNINSLLK